MLSNEIFPAKCTYALYPHWLTSFYAFLHVCIFAYKKSIMGRHLRRPFARLFVHFRSRQPPNRFERNLRDPPNCWNSRKLIAGPWNKLQVSPEPRAGYHDEKRNGKNVIIHLRRQRHFFSKSPPLLFWKALQTTWDPFRTPWKALWRPSFWSWRWEIVWNFDTWWWNHSL